MGLLLGYNKQQHMNKKTSDDIIPNVNPHFSTNIRVTRSFEMSMKDMKPSLITNKTASLKTTGDTKPDPDSVLQTDGGQDPAKAPVTIRGGDKDPRRGGHQDPAAD